MKILLVGDSCSAGNGFLDPKGKVWHSLLDPTHDITNLSVGGQCNQRIINKACTELFKNTTYELVILQYTSLFRINFNNSNTVYENPVNMTVDGTGPDRALQKFHDVWLKKYLHGRIEITEYLTQLIMINRLFKSIGIPFIFKKYFDNFFLDLEKDHWQNTSTAYKNIVLHMDQLPDWEINNIHADLRALYLIMVSESQNNWVNLTGPAFVDSMIDVADDLVHPGILSNRLYYQKFLDFSKTLGLQF